MMLDRSAILSAPALKRVEVEVPEWGGSVIVRELTAGELDVIQSSFVKEVRRGKERDFKLDYTNMRVKYVVRSLITEAGERVFQDTDLEALNKLSGSAIDTIFEVVQELNHLTDESMEGVTKNSESESGDGLPSDSPGPSAFGT